jgi:MFS family permease
MGTPQEAVALAVALVTDLGCALVFPALGVETLKWVLPANRGSAMGAFVAFLDIPSGVSGPVAGLIAGQFGYAAVYLFGVASVSFGAALVLTAPPPAVLMISRSSAAFAPPTPAIRGERPCHAFSFPAHRPASG